MSRSAARRFWCVVCSIALTWAGGVVEPAAAGDAPSPRSVILIIGDGMDDNQIAIARNYLVGARGRLGLDRMPVRSAVQVLTVDEGAPHRFVYVADSANSATSMASGVVTSRGRVGTTAGSDDDVVTILELARDAGLGTGLVTTSSVTDATPAAFVAHVRLRACQDPASMEEFEFLGSDSIDCAADLKKNGGPGSISEQLVASRIDILLGGGLEHFEPTIEGGTRSVRDEAVRAGYKIVTDAGGLSAASVGDPLIGLFAAGHLPARWRGEGGRDAEKPDPSLLNSVVWFAGSVELPEPMRCELNPDFGATPSLAAMTEAALRHLSHDPSRGFFLMIESASIDKQSHRRNACGAIGELQQLDEALSIANAFAAGAPGTLLLVTADHGHAAQIVPDESLFSSYGVPVHTPGHLVRVTTHDGAVMSVNYATNDFYAEEHTGVHVPLFVNEVGRGIVEPMVAQPDLFEIMRRHLGL